MLMWPELMEYRGSQKIMYCLLKYIKSLPLTVTNMDAYSDNAIVEILCFIVSNTKKQTVDHQFLVSGYSFLECGQGFALIKKCKRNSSFVFVPGDWYALVAKGNRKFTVSQIPVPVGSVGGTTSEVNFGSTGGTYLSPRLAASASSLATLHLLLSQLLGFDFIFFYYFVSSP